VFQFPIVQSLYISGLMYGIVNSDTALEFTDYNFRDTFYRPLFIFNAYRQLLWYVYDIFMPFFFCLEKAA